MNHRLKISGLKGLLCVPICSCTAENVFVFGEAFLIRYAGWVKILNIAGFLGSATMAVGVAWELGEPG